MKSRNHKLRRALALATVVGAVAAPAASAYPVGSTGSALRGPAPHYAVHAQSADDQPVPVAADGFDWGDAGIGAAGVFAVLAIGAGATVAVGHRPRRGHTVA